MQDNPPVTDPNLNPQTIIAAGDDGLEPPEAVEAATPEQEAQLLIDNPALIPPPSTIVYLDIYQLGNGLRDVPPICANLGIGFDEQAMAKVVILTVPIDIELPEQWTRMILSQDVVAQRYAAVGLVFVPDEI